MASAQVKSCVLLAGLGARGRDRGARARAHPPPHRGDARPLRGPAHRRRRGPAAAHVVRLGPSELSPLRARRTRRPLPGRVLGRRRLRGARQRGHRRACLRRAGPARLPRRPRSAWGRASTRSPSPAPAISPPPPTSSPASGRCAAPRSTPREITGLDEVPVLAVAAACASGDTVFRDVGELRVEGVRSTRRGGRAGGGLRGPGRGRR